MKTDKTIWVLEDKEEARIIYKEILELRYQLRFFSTLGLFESAWQAESKAPDLLIADLRLPDGNFLKFLQSHQNQEASLPPFMVVSCVDDVEILRSALSYNALDYLTQPFRKNELIAKLEKFLRKTKPLPVTQHIKFNVDTFRQTVRNSAGKEIKLTSKEIHIFNLLHDSGSKGMPRSEIIEKLWGTSPPTDRTLDVHLSNLRQKLTDLELEVLFIPPEKYSLLLLNRIY
jgi:DNA-binding response OmpR family regulator